MEIIVHNSSDIIIHHRPTCVFALAFSFVYTVIFSLYVQIKAGTNVRSPLIGTYNII